jgi:zinc transport system substrate-binding protein
VCAREAVDPVDKIKVFVSIIPQAYFVERIGGDRVDVSVMVGPGHSPATYEPLPKQMTQLSQARLYFRIGVPFENVWIERISRANPNMLVIDTRRGIELLPMDTHVHSPQVATHGHHEGLRDPHIWLSVRLVKIQARNICDALISEDPTHAPYYSENLRVFQLDLDRLDTEITEVLSSRNIRRFMVFHPAWGYFARDYQLDQMPIEVEGKGPSGKKLANLIERAREEGIKVIFVQQQFSTKSAEIVARAIGGKVIQIDPLDRDYVNNMRKIAHILAEVPQ